MEKTLIAGETDMDSIRARISGELVQMAIPVLKSYFSDFYRDVQWLMKYVTEPIDTVFFFGVSDTGTSIGDDLPLVRQGNDTTYRVIVRRHPYDRWTIETEVVES